jgi:hypothetical protein
VQVIPFVNTEACFALKGGTAINFFVRNFPRLSVDIDLVYLPVEDRPTTLRGIDAALQRIAVKIPGSAGKVGARVSPRCAPEPFGRGHAGRIGDSGIALPPWQPGYAQAHFKTEERPGRPDEKRFGGAHAQAARLDASARSTDHSNIRWISFSNFHHASAPPPRSGFASAGREHPERHPLASTCGPQV